MKRTRQSQQQVPNLKLSRHKRKLPKRGRARRSRQQGHPLNTDLTDPEMPPVSKKKVHQVPEGPLATRTLMSNLIPTKNPVRMMRNLATAAARKRERSVILRLTPHPVIARPTMTVISARK